MSAVIKVDNVSKMYRLGQFNTGALSQDLHRWLMLMLGREDPFLKVGESNDRSVSGKSNVVWSLKDLNFSIEKGDTVGIIGKNGAGKSTLLKLLSRVTSPTTGSIKVKGRVASLLEVGTGFHPELTGRENIFLNGAILGMRKQEIKEQLEAIVEFAGVARYLDTPVKRYSSGMFVRLGFAVAAHLRSEILIVDEVLAVGDAEFQKKCLGKMNDINKGEGRTILFVSHNMTSVQRLCKRGILLKNGEIFNQGDIQTVVESYLTMDGSSDSFSYQFEKGNKEAYVSELKIISEESDEVSELPVGTPWKVEAKVVVEKSTANLKLALGISTIQELPIRTTWSIPTDADPGEYLFVFDCSDLMLTSGAYKLVLGLSTDTQVLQYFDDKVRVTISDAGEVAKNEQIVNTKSGLILNQMPTEIKKV